MKKVNKSVLIWYSPQEMFALVTDVAHYAEFLPWCDQARVLEQDEQGMTAEVGIAFGGMRKSFVTRNTHSVLDDGGRQVSIRLVKGPFSRLEGNWMFHPVGDGSQRACRVELQLDYGFDNMALAAVVGPVFDRIAGSMVDAFIKRAEQVYG
ncbi:Ribosome association toxin RatA [Delftia tsuruhatensis]|uniref:type II toxin-antitoxin system RatA family toxin n=1 Tax=Delftia tsuruhatensis TaxID=180282 RepID=UPI001E6ACEF8|nr:type II toxin-antitoxin system RatA family toxin [Delftia tsuruhatensis]CAB5722165.1 Ribosome association toxin RatA [Delftia tsuruhatensis]CAC9686599.1 Ribosome association toxin RatA [Delftia tsuruhatensis]